MRKLNKDDLNTWLNTLTEEEYYPIRQFKRLNDKQQKHILDILPTEIGREPLNTSLKTWLLMYLDVTLTNKNDVFKQVSWWEYVENRGGCFKKLAP